MTKHEMDELAEVVAAKVCKGHECAFSKEERGELHQLAVTAKTVRKVTVGAILTVTGLLATGACYAVWEGLKALARK